MQAQRRIQALEARNFQLEKELKQHVLAAKIKGSGSHLKAPDPNKIPRSVVDRGRSRPLTMELKEDFIVINICYYLRSSLLGRNCSKIFSPVCFEPTNTRARTHTHTHTQRERERERDS